MSQPETVLSNDQLSQDLIQQSIAEDSRKQQLMDTLTLPANAPDRAESSTATDAAGDVLASAGSSGLETVVDFAADTLGVVGEFLGGLLSS